MDKEHKIIIDEIVKLLRGGNAHIGLKDALEGLPADARGDKPANFLTVSGSWSSISALRNGTWCSFAWIKNMNRQIGRMITGPKKLPLRMTLPGMNH